MLLIAISSSGQVTLVNLSGGPGSNSSASPLNGTPDDCPEGIGVNPNRRFDASTLVDSADSSCGASVPVGQASGTGNAAYFISQSGGTITQITASSGGTAASSVSLTEDASASAQGFGEVLINVEVSSPVLATFQTSLSSGGDGATAKVVVSSPFNCLLFGTCTLKLQACSNTAASGGRCAPSTENSVDEIPDSLVLEPGIYRFDTTAAVGVFNNISRRAAQSGTASSSFTVSFTSLDVQGACCLPSGDCEQRTESDCTSAGGTYQGDDSSCGSVACPEPTGACCLAPGECDTLTEQQCQLAGGTYKGDAVLCNEDSCDCTLTWTAPGGGDFAASSNWEPPVAPENSGDGCANLLMDQAGTFSVSVGNGATANSLTVLDGAPTLVGGTLALGGQALEDGLRIEDDARLTLHSGTLSSNGVVVGASALATSIVSPSFLRIEPNATLDVVGGLDLGREPDSFGELSFGGGPAQVSLGAAGGTNVGVFGRGRMLGVGPLDMNISEGMTLGVFAGSDALVELTGVDEGVGLVSLTVGETLTIGDGGKGVFVINSPALAEADRLAIGASEGGDGILTTSGANCAVNLSDLLEVGVSGTGELNVLDASAVRAVNASIGKGSAGQGSVNIEGADSRLVVSGALVAGQLGQSSLSIATGGIVEAGSLSVGDGPGVSGFLSLDGTVEDTLLRVTADATLGVFGVASLTASGASTISVDGSLQLGAFVGATATAFFSGGEGTDALKVNTISVKDALVIGAAGAASVNISGSSVVEVDSLRIAVEPGGNGSYSASGSLNFTKVIGELLVAGGGSGELLAKNGSSIRSSACVLGTAPGGVGSLRLESGATLRVEQTNREAPPEREAAVPGKDDLSVGFLEVGRLGNGLVELFDAGSQISCIGTIIGGDNTAAGGTLNIDTGARLTASDGIAVGNQAGPGLMRVASGANVEVAGVIIVGPNGRLVAAPSTQITCTDFFVFGQLEVVDSLTIARSAAVDAAKAEIKAIQSPAIIQGNVKMDRAAVLRITQGQGAALQISGATELAGTLELVLRPGESLSDNQLVDLIDFAGGSSGVFNVVNFINAPTGFIGDVELDGTTLQLRVISGGTGDVEGEGEVESPSAGCGGCTDKSQPLGKQLGDLLTFMAGLGILLVSHRIHSL